MGNQNWPIQRNWQHSTLGAQNTRRRQTKQKHNTIYVGHNYIQTNTNHVNKTAALLQTTGGQDEPNIVCMRKSQRTSQHGTQNIKQHLIGKHKILKRLTTATLVISRHHKIVCVYVLGSVTSHQGMEDTVWPYFRVSLKILFKRNT